jgi:hypothetical protein
MGLNSSIDMKEINKVVSLVFQIIGGFLILNSIDSNIGVVKNNSLFTLFTSWIKSWIKSSPFRQESNTSLIPTGYFHLNGYAPTFSTDGPGNTTEECIEYLQRQINLLKDKLEEEINNLKKQIGALEQRMNNEISKNRSAIGNVDQKITEIFVGDVEFQIFGVYLMIHGAVASYFA